MTLTLAETFDLALCRLLVSPLAGAVPDAHGGVPVAVAEGTDAVLVVQALDQAWKRKGNKTISFVFME